MAHAKKIKIEALKLWMDGKNYTQIGKILDISHMTIQAWSKKDNWPEKDIMVEYTQEKNQIFQDKKQLYQEEKKKDFANQIALKFEKYILGIPNELFGATFVAAKICREKMNAKLKEGLEIKDIEITRILKDTLLCASVYKAVCPDAPEQTTKQLIVEIDKMKILINKEISREVKIEDVRNKNENN